MGYIRPADHTAGKNVFRIVFFGPHNTVGGHENGPRKLAEFFHLVLPGGSVMAIEMFVLLQLWIAVGGQHFAVGVNIDSFSLGLLQQLVHILQVMSGYQNGLSLFFVRGELWSAPDDHRPPCFRHPEATWP